MEYNILLYSRIKSYRYFHHNFYYEQWVDTRSRFSVHLIRHVRTLARSICQRWPRKQVFLTLEKRFPKLCDQSFPKKEVTCRGRVEAQVDWPFLTNAGQHFVQTSRQVTFQKSKEGVSSIVQSISDCTFFINYTYE